MLKGFNGIGQKESALGNQYLQVFSTKEQKFLPQKFAVATTAEIEEAVCLAETAFDAYKIISPENRAVFLETIAEEITNLGHDLILMAMQESGLPEARLLGEKARTIGQLKLFAGLLREGSWVNAVIDTAMPDRSPFPRSDIRMMQVPLGPVVVFGASNFPFAFSTLGGDTVSALAGGNPVIVKAHESHLGTNELMASAIKKAIEKCQIPDGTFSFVIGNGPITGLQLVKHPGVKAIGFTGSFKAGMAIYKAAVNDRAVPIPVFAEMSSINPMLLLRRKLQQDAPAAATVIANSITLGVGQFCTNPGMLFLIDDDDAAIFVGHLIKLLSASPPALMLNPDVCNNYYKSFENITQQNGVKILYKGNTDASEYKASAALLQVSDVDFINNPSLQQEVFGPSSLIVLCKNESTLLTALKSLQGQLTATVFGDVIDIQKFAAAINILSNKVGRIIYNNVPTGVEVCPAMVHGGPFPATTDARSSSVGTLAINRFVRPLCFQDCPQEFLPDALKNENPLNIMRKINGRYTAEMI